MIRYMTEFEEENIILIKGVLCPNNRYDVLF